MDHIAKINWRDGEFEILAANSFEALGRIVGQAFERDFALSPVTVEYSVNIPAPEKAPVADEVTPTAGVPIVLAFPHQRIADMVTTALESPVGDWLKRAIVVRTAIDSKPLDNHFPWYSQGAYWTQPAAALECTVENPVNDHSGWNKGKNLRMEDFQLALILMATKDDGTYSRHFADFLRGNEDALTADLFMQLAVYGEEVYA